MKGDRQEGAVYAVVQDVGGAHAVLPVVRRLRATGVTVTLWCHNGIERHRKNGLVKLYPELIEARAASTLQDFGDLSDLKLVITSLCSGTGGAGRLLASASHMLGIPVVGIQDCWDIRIQGGKEAGWQGHDILPTLLVLPHLFCDRYTYEAWPSMTNGQIMHAWPAMDRFQGSLDASNRAANAAKIKQRLGITSPGPLVAIMTGVRDPVPLLEGALAALAGGDASILFKPHSRLKRENLEGFQRVRELCHDAGSQVRWVTSADIPDNDELVQGVTAVVAKASTTLEAAFVGTVGITYGDADNTPFVRTRAVPLARNPDELKTLISRAVNGELAAEFANAWRSLRTDGHDAECVAEHIIRTFLTS